MYIVCYDISNTRIRNKVFKEMKNYGRHTQLSVFECDISQKQLGSMVKKLGKLMEGEEEGSIPMSFS